MYMYFASFRVVTKVIIRYNIYLSVRLRAWGIKDYLSMGFRTLPSRRVHKDHVVQGPYCVERRI
jgi:hypothetical protein